MSDVVGRLWGFAHNLRHDGVDYGDYIEQITYLLFLKMADEQDVELPEHTDWPHLRGQSGVALVEHYEDALRTLGKQQGILGDIFAASQNRLTNPATLAQLVKSVDETEWTSLKVDVKAAAFEGLLEKAAAEGKKGAGQYFTPRPLIQSMVRLMKPDPRVSKDFAIGDPACGTGGFLVAAYEWLKEQTGGAFDRDTAKRIRTKTYYGQELVARPRRLALMNLYLHQVEPHIRLGDSIYEAPTSQRFDVILTNPPFGTKGANQAPVRDDFVVETSNKQLNFVQHVLTLLKPGGRAAVVVPDNVLFADQAGEVFKVLMEDSTSTRCCAAPAARSRRTPPAPRRTSSSSRRVSRPRRSGSTTPGPTSRPSPRSPGRLRRRTSPSSNAATATTPTVRRSALRAIRPTAGASSRSRKSSNAATRSTASSGSATRSSTTPTKSSTLQSLSVTQSQNSRPQSSSYTNCRSCSTIRR
jgi:SAM-dependent methyltransferase